MAEPALVDGAGLRPIGAVAREVGLTPRAIRYYEEVGLLRPAVRVKGADRLFDASDVERLHQIKRLREVIGFSLAEIRELLDTDDTRARLKRQFSDATDPTARARVVRDAIALAERRLAIVEGKLAQVAAVRDEEAQRLARLRAMLTAEGVSGP
ncbi:MAG TPA: MerR family transcriptional regulator [Thermomicrobiales bacterium]|nr:MerR family transcriptional regulator [Thermomicrobiales bacterium]